jgi:hypothetical protein
VNTTQVAIVIGAVVWVVLMTVLTIRGRKHVGRPGPGTIGTVYDMLNQDRRNAIEIILEERAEARDPEDRDGNLPDLETPKRTGP